MEQKSLIPNIDFEPKTLPGLGLEVINLEDLYKTASVDKLVLLNTPHRIKFYGILIFTGGEGNHFVDFRTFPVEKNTCVIINQNQVHAFDTENRPSAQFILFTKHFLKLITKVIDNRVIAPTQFLSLYQPSFKLTVSQTHRLLNLIDLIKAEYVSPDLNMPCLQLLFSALLTRICEERPDTYLTDLNTNQVACFERFIYCLETNIAFSHDANAYANRVGTSYKTLNKICKLATQQTAKQLIDAYIILNAKRALSIDKLQVKQVSDILGFDEATNFVKFFKKHTLMTPKLFQSQDFK